MNRTTRADKNAERSRLDQEIRFIKTQQFAVATATMTLLGALLGIVHLFKPLHLWEKVAVTVGAVFVAAVGCCFFVSLWHHLARTRLLIDTADKQAWKRGRWVLWVLAAIIVASALIVVYALWTLPRDAAPSFHE